MLERILVPLDVSRHSARALPYAIEAARRFDAEVIMVYVVRPALVPAHADPTAMVGPSGAELIIDSARRQEAETASRARRYLQAKLRSINRAGLRGRYHILLGDPAEAIIDFCRKESIDLVVMTTTGKSGLKRAILGSVADRVIREPGFPVLVIRDCVKGKHNVSRKASRRLVTSTAVTN